MLLVGVMYPQHLRWGPLPPAALPVCLHVAV